MARQYFYLVVCDYDECTFPQKIFLQEHEAIQWGRRQATKTLLETGDSNYTFKLFRQEINRTDTLEKVKYLKPYPTKELVKAGLISVPKLPEDADIFGADYDIDKERL